jgi:hypothetical protein
MAERKTTRERSIRYEFWIRKIWRMERRKESKMDWER